jgi:hypothetical protein
MHRTCMQHCSSCSILTKMINHGYGVFSTFP